MTRINVIPVEDLHYKHLVAEYHELPRIFNYVRRAQDLCKDVSDYHIPEDYVLGTGHCTFFYDKLGWLAERFKLLGDEMRRRGYKANHSAENILYGIDPKWINGWTPTQNAIEINTARINERLEHMARKKQNA